HQAIARLVDYQDRRYAERYLERLSPFARDPGRARVVARHLAVWMTYEDAIRVAQLKTRPSRFERIRREKGAQRGEIVVTDFLKPDLDEIYGILPDRLVAPFARWAERRWPYGRPAFGQEVKTTTVLGYLRVWLLTLLRPLRPISYRARHEHARMDRWLRALARRARRRWPTVCSPVSLRPTGAARSRRSPRPDRSSPRQRSTSSRSGSSSITGTRVPLGLPR